MNENTRKTMMNATARVYREHAAALRAIIPVVNNFDGKIIDKRFETAMNAAALPDGLNYHFSWVTTCGQLEIKAYNHNRSYRETPETPGGYACTGADQLRNFEKKYSHEARDLNGLYYCLNYCGSSDTREYSIR